MDYFGAFEAYEQKYQVGGVHSTEVRDGERCYLAHQSVPYADKKNRFSPHRHLGLSGTTAMRGTAADPVASSELGWWTSVSQREGRRKRDEAGIELLGKEALSPRYPKT